MNKGLILGFFDGVHIGHQAVIRSAVEYADEAVLITFKNSPAEYFQQEYKYIYPRQKSIEKIKSLGVNRVVELDFSKIASMSAENYLQYLIEEFAPISISTGFNHTFGKNKSGNSVFLEQNALKYGYKYFCMPAMTDENEIVSSTLIKDLLFRGDIGRANRLLRSRFALNGHVIKGAQLGHTIGFPTANIEYPKDIVQIPFGVYGGKVRIRDSSGFAYAHPLNDSCTAILNWGVKPTVNNSPKPVVEVHIIGFEGDLYGQDIEFEILKKLRDEKKFENLEELKTQIEKDVEECLKL